MSYTFTFKNVTSYSIKSNIITIVTDKEPEIHRSPDTTVYTDTIEIYTDGACSKNGKKEAKAGIGIVVPSLNIKISKRLPDNYPQTNNAAELYAIFAALELSVDKKWDKVTIYSDSQYSINCLTKWYLAWQKNGWKTKNNKPVKNANIIQDCLILLGLSDVEVDFKYIKAHADSVYNNLADTLAKKAQT